MWATRPRDGEPIPADAGDPPWRSETHVPNLYMGLKGASWALAVASFRGPFSDCRAT